MYPAAAYVTLPRRLHRHGSDAVLLPSARRFSTLCRTALCRRRTRASRFERHTARANSATMPNANPRWRNAKPPSKPNRPHRHKPEQPHQAPHSIPGFDCQSHGQSAIATGQARLLRQPRRLQSAKEAKERAELRRAQRDAKYGNEAEKKLPPSNFCAATKPSREAAKEASLISKTTNLFRPLRAV